ncbi:MAG: AraC family transcriptional regulator [Proteobacteria bacterium]|nr:AraC family transcriptional regulator [Pseudomonadota bacterium]
MTQLSFSPALRVFRFNDVDEFRQSIQAVEIKFTPLAQNISSSQTILSLPGFDINLVRSFPRVMDLRLKPGCTAVGFPMTGRSPLRMNGIDADIAFLVIGRGGGGYSSVERVALHFTSFIFTPEVVGRGWPEPGEDFLVFEMTDDAQQKLRDLVLEVMNFASSSPDELAVPGVSDGIRESMLSAIDHAFATRINAVPLGFMHGARYVGIVRKAEEIVSVNLGHPIYSQELANKIGVSVRTLHSAILRHRGMSLHRYLRLKRLWLVRQRLREGNISVKACALAHGFWHLGEFSKSYRRHFGEAPSETVARAR